MSYFSYENNGRGGFFGSIPPAIKNIIIINVLVQRSITKRTLEAREALSHER